jgi:hypothetical protein
MADEKNTRLARTKLPDGTIVEREWTPHERYMLYVRGFRDGAAVKAMAHSGLGAYDRGYADGRDARASAADAYAKEVGYEPTILRLATDSPSNGEPK